ncbi:MAG: hypothetical protein GQ470_02195 [Gammaproteobacteria bacterium]|nr:hypothetical protein [Gammaproteobacteria bacterium]
MNHKPNIFNKVSLFSSKASFLMALLSAVFLYLRVNEHGYENPISASLLGSLFFFIFMGVLLFIIGNCNIPSFKFESSENGPEKG